MILIMTYRTKKKILKVQNAKKTANSCLWESQNVPNGQMRCLLHIYMLRQIQWAQYGVIQSGSFCSILFIKSKMQKKKQFRACGRVKMSPMGKKGVRCTSTWWDEYNELDLAWFGAVVFALQCLQSPKHKKTVISCPWASQNVPNGQIRYPLHIYMLRQIQWT